MIKKAFEIAAVAQVVGYQIREKVADVVLLPFSAEVKPDGKKWRVNPENWKERQVMFFTRIVGAVFGGGLGGHDPFSAIKTEDEAISIAGAVEDLVRKEYPD